MKNKQPLKIRKITSSPMPEKEKERILFKCFDIIFAADTKNKQKSPATKRD